MNEAENEENQLILPTEQKQDTFFYEKYRTEMSVDEMRRMYCLEMSLEYSSDNKSALDNAIKFESFLKGKTLTAIDGGKK